MFKARLCPKDGSDADASEGQFKHGLNKCMSEWLSVIRVIAITRNARLFPTGAEILDDRIEAETAGRTCRLWNVPYCGLV